MKRPVKGYEGLYEITDTGRVISCERFTADGKHLKEREIKGGFFSNGYKFACLRKNGCSRNHLIHRLVAEAFIDNPGNLPVVNHIDGDRVNNQVTNLEWVTRSRNLEHAVEIGLMKSQCKIRRKVTIRCGERITTFDTMKDCAAYFGFKKGWLHNRIRKHGCTFKYKEYEIEVHGRGNDK